LEACCVCGGRTKTLRRFWARSKHTHMTSAHVIDGWETVFWGANSLFWCHTELAPKAA
jgi:hypothetical protein